MHYRHQQKLQQSNMAKQKNKQKFKVRQPQRAAKSKRPNAPSDGSKNNGIQTTKQEEYPSRHPTNRLVSALWRTLHEQKTNKNDLLACEPLQVEYLCVYVSQNLARLWQSIKFKQC